MTDHLPVENKVVCHKPFKTFPRKKYNLKTKNIVSFKKFITNKEYEK